MTSDRFDIRLERDGDRPGIEQLLDQAFGGQRHQKTAYRLRENNSAIDGLSFVALVSDRLVGTIGFWPITIGDHPALLLGPLAVAQDFKGHQCGIALMRHGLEKARALGHSIVILVGDEPYYSKVGFRKIPGGLVTLPGPVDPDRLLICELQEGAFAGVRGNVTAAGR